MPATWRAPFWGYLSHDYGVLGLLYGGRTSAVSPKIHIPSRPQTPSQQIKSQALRTLSPRSLNVCADRQPSALVIHRFLCRTWGRMGLLDNGPEAHQAQFRLQG